MPSSVVTIPIMSMIRPLPSLPSNFWGAMLPKGAIANRLGDFADITELETRGSAKDSDLVEADSVGEKRGA
jgi:hypothetical protein